MIKRGLGLVVLGFLIATVMLSAGVLAVTPENTILKINSVSNAHGELWSGTNYNTIIDYSAIFGSSYTALTGAAAHQCDGTDLILKLSDVTNAHAEIPTGTYYQTAVCHKGVKNCHVETVASGSGVCTTGKAIVGLSSTTNAHLEVPGNNGYTTLICCDKVTAAPAVLYGDVNQDGVVNQADIIALVNIIIHVTATPAAGSNAFVASDVNGDGTINSVDNAILSDFIIGRITSFPVERKCGDKVVENPNADSIAEQCDLGSQNGVYGSGCSATCQSVDLCPEVSCPAGDPANTICAGVNVTLYKQCSGGQNVKCGSVNGTKSCTPSDILNTNWQNLYGQGITEVAPRRTVRLTAEVGNAVTSVDFVIKEDEKCFFSFTCPPHNLRTISGVPVVAGRANATWTISDSDLALAGQKDIYNVYFTATGNSGNSLESDKLMVGNSINEEAPIDHPPQVVITNPSADEMDVVNTPVQFSETATDDFTLPEDLIVQWNVEGISDSDKTQSTFSHTFSTTGSKDIGLSVRDSGGNSAEANRQIEVIDLSKVNLITRIESPHDQEIIINSSGMVKYSGKDSYVMNVTRKSAAACDFKAECLAGGCPSVQEVGDCQITVTGTGMGDYSKLTYLWDFGNGVTSSANSGTQIMLPTDEKKTITLTLSYPGLTDSLSREFWLLSSEDNTNGICSADGSELFFLKNDGQGNKVVDYSLQMIGLSTSQCSMPDGTTCCPLGYSCLTTPNGQGNLGCLPTVSQTGTSCDAYIDKSSCEGVDVFRDLPDYYASEGCGNLIGTTGNIKSCYSNCVWNDTDSTCHLGFDTINSAGDIVNSGCYTTTIFGECKQDGFMDSTSTNTCTGSSVPSKVACNLGSVFELPFFGLFQFITAAGATILIYSVFFRKRRS